MAVLESIARCNAEASRAIARRVAEKYGADEGVVYRAVFAALWRGTDRGRAIDVLRIACESAGIVYNPADWAQSLHSIQ